jgi:hypothetical protein
VSKPTLASGHLPLKSSMDNSHQAFNYFPASPPWRCLAKSVYRCSNILLGNLYQLSGLDKKPAGLV